jgi:hypothetical protein
MIKSLIRVSGFALLAICSMGALSPANSFVDLPTLFCNTVYAQCQRNCNGSASDYDLAGCLAICDDDYATCLFPPKGNAQAPYQPPPPCKGLRCTLRPPPKTTDPTAPRRPITTAKPTTPFKPVGNSNPNGPKSGTNNPVIFERKDESGGGQFGGHGSGGGGHGK